jgi:hypothetical protein
MSDHQHCRLSVRDGELEIAGPPTALRALAGRLRQHGKGVEVPITGGFVTQEVTSGPLLVSLQGATMVHVSGGREYLDIIWEALEGVAGQAETADDRNVNRHQHIEYFPGDEYRSRDSVPLVIVADWPEE